LNKTYKIFCLSETITPCTHADRSEGNESLVARRVYHTPEGARAIPFLSGNAIRQRLVRGPGARFLIERWGLQKTLDLRTLNFLFHGGNLSESTARTDTAAISTMHRLFPLMRILGGALPDAIVPGFMLAWEGLLVCREHAGRLRTVCPWEIPTAIRPAEDFVAGYQYTRSDAAKTATDLVQVKSGESTTANLMIYAGQCVMPGAHFAHGFIIRSCADLELGALLLSLRLWQHAGATVGGMAAKGHGRLHTLISGDLPDDEESLVSAYVAHVDASKDEAVKWMVDTFAPPTEEETAKKASKKNKGKPAPVLDLAGGVA
jgi:hypothetical protein